jgi:uncharacterized membrane protein YhhN
MNKKKIIAEQIWSILAILVPTLLYIGYAVTKVYLWRFLITAFLLALVLTYLLKASIGTSGIWKEYGAIPLAFLFSIIGDFFLHLKGTSLQALCPSLPSFLTTFILGVAFFFLAHCSYIVFFLKHGKVNWFIMWTLVGLMAIYSATMLMPSIKDKAISIAVILYILISCLSVSCAAGMKMDKGIKYLMVAGISSLLFSDYLISQHNFLHVNFGYFLMLPTYYLSQVLISIALFTILLGKTRNRCSQ